jgi:nucleotide-binding universal stress UspA family protein
MNVKKILLATDFSEDARVALEASIGLAKQFDATLRVLHSYYVDVPAIYGGLGGDVLIPTDIVAPVKEAAEKAVEELVADLASKGISASGRAVLGDASGAILRDAEEIGADMIVMGTRGLTGLKHVLLGSTAERVVRLAECPVLTLKAKY